MGGTMVFTREACWGRCDFDELALVLAEASWLEVDRE